MSYRRSYQPSAASQQQVEDTGLYLLVIETLPEEYRWTFLYQRRRLTLTFRIETHHPLLTMYFDLFSSQNYGQNLGSYPAEK
ncbi:hypothetical protein INT44_006318 [Umbelopsis vinacea]|uniref:Uncharacterized protein n=1 Tax=Umbelopsis vinacea TaxID=44442 RepID=A0A8H7PSI3_9FUNG|nr:hypothetical protein INT44_006318 [Umbelopsis vinacea]